MIIAQRLLTDVERAPVERLGLRVLPLQVVERCQAVETDGGGRMIFAQRFLTDVESALVERFGLHVLPLRGVEYRQVVEDFGGVRMIFSQRLLADFERRSEEHTSELQSRENL